MRPSPLAFVPSPQQYAIARLPPQLLLDAQLLVLPINMASGVVEARRLR